MLYSFTLTLITLHLFSLQSIILQNYFRIYICQFGEYFLLALLNMYFMFHFRERPTAFFAPLDLECVSTDLQESLLLLHYSHLATKRWQKEIHLLKNAYFFFKSKQMFVPINHIRFCLLFSWNNVKVLL